MKRFPAIWLLVAVLSLTCIGCGTSDNTVTVTKPRLHKTWPKKHKWHKKLKVWKFSVQMPERGGVKKVRMKN